MKRIIFMGIAIMAIFVSSCKKEEMQAPAGRWILVKKNVTLGKSGIIADAYQNTTTKQVVYKPVMLPKSNIKYDGHLITEEHGVEVTKCKSPTTKTKNCTVRTIDGEKVILVKPAQPLG